MPYVRLHSLFIEGSYNITGNLLLALARSAPTLKKLQFERCTVSLDTLHALAEFPALASVSLSRFSRPKSQTHAQTGVTTYATAAAPVANTAATPPAAAALPPIALSGAASAPSPPPAALLTPPSASAASARTPSPRRDGAGAVFAWLADPHAYRAPETPDASGSQSSLSSSLNSSDGSLSTSLNTSDPAMPLITPQHFTNDLLISLARPRTTQMQLFLDRSLSLVTAAGVRAFLTKATNMKLFTLKGCKVRTHSA